MKKYIVAAFMLAFAASFTFGFDDFENPKAGAVKWKVFDYNRIQAHPARLPSKIDGGIAFDFLNTPDTALLATSHPSYRGDLLGDMTGKTVSTTVGVTATPLSSFSYYGQGGSGDCGTPASVRFYFETSTSGAFAYTDYWWSNPTSAQLAALSLGGDQTMVVDISDPAVWSDWNGKVGTTDPAAFAAAVKDVQLIGLSFGGGCFFENGVGIQNGTGKFRLMDFTAIP